MNKKWLVLGSVIGISSLMMVTTGISAMAGTSGYDAYKSALKNSKTVKSVTVQAAASLRDNGNVALSANGTFKMSREGGSASGTGEISAGGEKQTLQFYKQGEQAIFKPGSADVYYVKDTGTEAHKRFKGSGEKEMPQHVETVVDALVGNLKDYVAVDVKEDGSKRVSAELDGAQLPAVVQAIAPIVIKQASREHGEPEKKTDTADTPLGKGFLKDAAPELTGDIRLEKVAVNATISPSNYIRHQEAELTISGKDAGGQAHQVVVHLQADLSGYDSTTPDTVDLTGKNVQPIQSEHRNKRQGNNG
ncbi:hypothetical protein [Paenibacillus sp. UNC499MF]|uniref:hypothetical protein n=1 Tax=Paenibacillus sp. UNC499MF TaxID=1502751 RepID=UPI00089FFE16|nr:hypothetical protein [Paenibacillus sp. UNC499MF]SEG44188.1 hypothetical protein SAMN02799616_02981 [Paenibacillus sp. UNC499MF]